MSISFKRGREALGGGAQEAICLKQVELRLESWSTLLLQPKAATSLHTHTWHVQLVSCWMVDRWLSEDLKISTQNEFFSARKRFPHSGHLGVADVGGGPLFRSDPQTFLTNVQLPLQTLKGPLLA